MAVWDEENYIHIVDRKKDIIISGGENISSIEVERAIFAHPAVLECAVVSAPDPQWGEVPAAVVVLKPGASLTEQELCAHLQGRIAKFKVAEPGELRVLGHRGQLRAVPAGPRCPRDRGRDPRRARPGVRAARGRRGQHRPARGTGAPPGATSGLPSCPSAQAQQSDGKNDNINPIQPIRRLTPKSDGVACHLPPRQ